MLGSAYDRHFLCSLTEHLYHLDRSSKYFSQRPHPSQRKRIHIAATHNPSVNFISSNVQSTPEFKVGKMNVEERMKSRVSRVVTRVTLRRVLGG